MIKAIKLFNYFALFLKSFFIKFSANKLKTKNYLIKLIPIFLTQISPVKSRLDNFELQRRASSVRNLDKQEIQHLNLDIIYINISSRTDRNLSVRSELSKLEDFDYSRFDAIKNENGALGCALSHLNVLKSWSSNSDSLLMVCEDDIELRISNKEFKLLLDNFQNDSFMDVLCLGFNHFNGVNYKQDFVLSSNIQTTSCYILKPHMRDVLIKVFSDSVEMLEHGVDSRFAALDIVWKLIQSKYNFFVTRQRFVIQKPFYSDIQSKEVNYEL